MLLHVCAHTVGVLEEPQMAQLVDLVRTDALLARVTEVPVQILGGTAEEAASGINVAVRADGSGSGA